MNPSLESVLFNDSVEPIHNIHFNRPFLQDCDDSFNGHQQILESFSYLYFLFLFLFYANF